MRFSFFTLSLFSLASAGLIKNKNNPIVDLGYGRWQATLNNTGDVPYYNFSNIRYAEAPLGNLRFKPPHAVTSVNRTVNDGQEGAICTQAFPSWMVTENEYLEGVSVSVLEAESAAASSSISLSSIPDPAPMTSEDCLLLDIIVPKKIWNAATNKAPVLVWIYGGGYTSGSKWGSGNPATLISRSYDNDGEGMVYVTLNYRLGLYGFQAGPTYQNQGGTSNLGLLDQRFALEWIQRNIHLFGGDKDRVTVMGESAGAGSILHQITAYGGSQGAAPFQQAILQSTAFIPQPATSQVEEQYATTLSYASYVSGKNISTLRQLRQLSEEELYYINYAVIGSSLYGTNTFGPSLDGDFVPELPGQLLAAGEFDHDVKLMIGHNINEGYIFSDPMIGNNSQFDTYIAENFPAADNETLSTITQTLYPPPSSSTTYTSQLQRLAMTITDFVFYCNGRYLEAAFENNTYSYQFTVPPGFHGEDLAYTFFNGDTTTKDFSLAVNTTVAAVFQQYINNFVANGNPNGDTVPTFPTYGSSSKVANINITDLGVTKTDIAAASAQRCLWWQEAYYY